MGGSEEEQATYSVEEAGRRIGISRPLAYRAVREGLIPSIRIGRRLLVPKAALERLLACEDFVPRPVRVAGSPRHMHHGHHRRDREQRSCDQHLD